MIYEYKCKSCEEVFEVWQKMSDPAPEACEKCGAPGGVERIISSTTFALKGSGWYSSGYQKTGAGASTEKKSTGGSN
jgi:putative FmdB family regulatory protein